MATFDFCFQKKINAHFDVEGGPNFCHVMIFVDNTNTWKYAQAYLAPSMSNRWKYVENIQIVVIYVTLLQ